MSEWKPIETAPKDGTHILAYGRWRDGGAPNLQLVSWFTAVHDGWWTSACLPFDPTHWQPLPAPPNR